MIRVNDFEEHLAGSQGRWEKPSNLQIQLFVGEKKKKEGRVGGWSLELQEIWNICKGPLGTVKPKSLSQKL